MNKKSNFYISRVQLMKSGAITEFVNEYYMTLPNFSNAHFHNKVNSEFCCFKPQCNKIHKLVRFTNCIIVISIGFCI